jgi:phosphopantetheinyl transferase
VVRVSKVLVCHGGEGMSGRETHLMVTRKQRERETETHRERQRDTEMEREKDRERERGCLCQWLPLVSLLLHLGPQPVEWCLSHSGQIFPQLS